MSRMIRSSGRQPIPRQYQPDNDGPAVALRGGAWTDATIQECLPDDGAESSWPLVNWHDENVTTPDRKPDPVQHVTWTDADVHGPPRRGTVAAAPFQNLTWSATLPAPAKVGTTAIVHRKGGTPYRINRPTGPKVPAVGQYTDHEARRAFRAIVPSGTWRTRTRARRSDGGAIALGFLSFTDRAKWAMSGRGATFHIVPRMMSAPIVEKEHPVSLVAHEPYTEAPVRVTFHGSKGEATVPLPRVLALMLSANGGVKFTPCEPCHYMAWTEAHSLPSALAPTLRATHPVGWEDRTVAPVWTSKRTAANKVPKPKGGTVTKRRTRAAILSAHAPAIAASPVVKVERITPAAMRRRVDAKVEAAARAMLEADSIG